MDRAMSSLSSLAPVTRCADTEPPADADPEPVLLRMLRPQEARASGPLPSPQLAASAERSMEPQREAGTLGLLLAHGTPSTAAPPQLAASAGRSNELQSVNRGLPDYITPRGVASAGNRNTVVRTLNAKPANVDADDDSRNPRRKLVCICIVYFYFFVSFSV